MKNVLIIGAGAQAKYITDIFNLTKPPVNIIGIADVENNPDIIDKKINDIPVKGYYADLLDKIPTDTFLIIAYSNNQKKESIVNEIKDSMFSFINAIHPKAVISPKANIGIGIIVNAGAIIQPTAKVGCHVMLHANTVVEHDNIIEDYVNLAPGVTLGGYVTIKTGATVFTGATIIPGVTVGSNAVVGAGAVVLKDVPDNKTVVGNPARIIK